MGNEEQRLFSALRSTSATTACGKTAIERQFGALISRLTGWCSTCTG